MLLELVFEGGGWDDMENECERDRSLCQKIVRIKQGRSFKALAYAQYMPNTFFTCCCIIVIIYLKVYSIENKS